MSLTANKDVFNYFTFQTIKQFNYVIIRNVIGGVKEKLSCTKFTKRMLTEI